MMERRKRGMMVRRMVVRSWGSEEGFRVGVRFVRGIASEVGVNDG